MQQTKRIATWWLMALLCVLPAFAQDNNENNNPAFGEIVDVRVVNLEVVVTDGKERVRGLTSDDFRLQVNGEEVPIEFFTEVRGGQAIAGPANSTGTVPALQPGEPVGTRYLVFIDDSFTVGPQRNRVLIDLEKQLPHLGPQDHMAVVAYRGGGVDLLTTWTNSLNKLERVFREARDRPSDGMRRRFDRDLDVTQRYIERGINPQLFYSAANYYASPPRGGRTHNEVVSVIEAATSTLRGFSNPPGRKVMIMLSGGWPTPSYDWASFSSNVDYGAWSADRALFNPLIDTANRLGYTLYPVDVKGLENHFGSAEFGSLRNAEFARELRSEREWIEEGVLIQLAKETGGQAILDSARSQAFSRTVEDTRSYYWIGFTPSWQGNDKRHRVKVEALGKGMKVRTRESFSDLSPRTEITMLVESAQLFDAPLPAEEEVNVAFGEPRNAGRNRVVVPLQVEIPLDEITILPGSSGYNAHLELRVAVTDDRGERAEIPVIPIDLQLAQEATPGQMGLYKTELKLRTRPHRVLVTLYDPASGAILAKRTTLAL